jgi:hypothetical protein
MKSALWPLTFLLLGSACKQSAQSSEASEIPPPAPTITVPSPIEYVEIARGSFETVATVERAAIRCGVDHNATSFSVPDGFENETHLSLQKRDFTAELQACLLRAKPGIGSEDTRWNMTAFTEANR